MKYLQPIQFPRSCWPPRVLNHSSQIRANACFEWLKINKLFSHKSAIAYLVDPQFLLQTARIETSPILFAQLLLCRFSRHLNMKILSKNKKARTSNSRSKLKKKKNMKKVSEKNNNLKKTTMNSISSSFLLFLRFSLHFLYSASARLIKESVASTGNYVLYSLVVVR